MDRNSLCTNLRLSICHSNTIAHQVPNQIKTWTPNQSWYTSKADNSCNIFLAISLVSGVAYLWLISKALLEEIREHQPDRKDDYFMGWSTVLKNLEIFLPLTQVPVLGSFLPAKTECLINV